MNVYNPTSVTLLLRPRSPRCSCALCGLFMCVMADVQKERVVVGKGGNAGLSKQGFGFVAKCPGYPSVDTTPTTTVLRDV